MISRTDSHCRNQGFPRATDSNQPSMRSVKSGDAMVIVLIVIVVIIAIVVVVGLGLAAWLLTPLVSGHGEAERNEICEYNLMNIGIAMHTYHENYGTLPPAYIPDATGKSMHSWRTLLLPFLGDDPTYHLENDPIYQRYDSDRPWDSPGNQAVIAESIVPGYRCPLASDGTTHTNYMMVTGPGTVGDGAKATRFRDIKDGTSSTIIVVEVMGMNVHWAEPRDITVAELKRLVEAQSANSHPGGLINVLCADGSVHRLGPDSIDLLDGLTTINGGESVYPP